MPGAKRSKQYRKLLQQYQIAFGFREPYQVLVDSEILKDADRFKMDLIGGLEKTLQGKVKPMVTQCSIRHLYALSKEPGMSFVIDRAKMFERRRCGHMPEEYPEPLSDHDCIMSCVDLKGGKTNKNRYVVATQDEPTRRALRGVKGVPLIYIKRSVMVMEPMAEGSTRVREGMEKSKFRDGLRRGVGGGEKRKREDDDGDERAKVEVKKSRVQKGPKGPNPLSMKKKKKDEVKPDGTVGVSGEAQGDEESEAPKRKRKRKTKNNTGQEAVVVRDGDERDPDGED